jgi:protein-disulfide isomerase
MIAYFSRMDRSKKIVLGGVAALLVGLGLLLLFRPDPAAAPGEALSTSSTIPNISFGGASGIKPQLIADHAPMEGPMSAKVKIVEFLDFQCPGCGGYHPVLKQMRLEFKDRIQYVVRHFPLVEIHEYAKGAAIASVCAQRQGKFFEYTDLLFNNQNYLRRNDLENYAEEMKLDMDAFKTCLDDPEVEAIVIRDRKEGEALGVKFTPSIYINGKLMEELVPPEDLRNIIGRELAK